MSRFQRLDFAERRLLELLALNGGDLAGADISYRQQLTQEFFFHLVGATEEAAQFVNEEYGLGVGIEHLSVKRVANASSNLSIKSKLGWLHVDTRNRCLTRSFLLTYSDETYIFRILNYRHHVTHRGSNPFHFRALTEPRSSLLLDPRYPNLGPATKSAQEELQYMFQLVKSRLDDIWTLAKFEEAIRTTVRNWHPLPPGPPIDPNLTDVSYLSGNIQKICDVTLRASSSSKEEAVSIVELVERFIHSQSPPVVRSRSVDQVTSDLTHLAESVLMVNPQFGSMPETVTKSLLLWYGCLMMAKVCRPVDSAGKAIPSTHRIEVHSRLMEESRTNPWIKLGFISTRVFLQKRHQSPVDEWVPKDSAYWMG